MIKTEQKNIRQLSLEELDNYFESLREKKFRAKQVYEWLWLKQAQSFDQMTNLSKELRNKLKEDFTLPALVWYEVAASQINKSGTVVTDLVITL